MRTAQPPSAVQMAFLLWLVVVGAGVFETTLIVATGAGGDDVFAGVALRGVVFAAAVLVAVRMRAGRRWARLALTLVLGIFGTLSLVVGPISWLLAGNSLSAAMADTDASGWLFAGSRAIHVIAVLGAVACMFLPAANAYFRARLPQATAVIQTPDPITSAPIHVRTHADRPPVP